MAKRPEANRSSLLRWVGLAAGAVLVVGVLFVVAVGMREMIRAFQRAAQSM